LALLEAETDHKNYQDRMNFVQPGLLLLLLLLLLETFSNQQPPRQRAIKEREGELLGQDLRGEKTMMRIQMKLKAWRREIEQASLQPE
jgi:hypothetical protein